MANYPSYLLSVEFGEESLDTEKSATREYFNNIVFNENFRLNYIYVNVIECIFYFVAHCCNMNVLKICFIYRIYTNIY